MINALVHVPPLYIANVILPLASVCSHVLGITPCIGYVKHAHPQHLKVLKHFVYIQYGCGMQSLGVCSLNHDTATSYRLGHTHFPLKFTPTCTCNNSYGCTHMPIHSISRCSNTLYTSNMDVGCSQWGFAASTMTPQHPHTGLAIPRFP